MSALKEFEREVIKMLVGGRIPPVELGSLLESGSIDSYEHTGVGYFLTVRHAAIPSERIVCYRPMVIGKADDYECGFVVFLEDGVLTFECHSWGDSEVPEDFRERQVKVAPAA